MSVSSEINVCIGNKKNTDIWGIIQILLDSGWSVSKDEKVTFLPLGDNGMYDLHDERLSLDIFKGLVKAKESLSETVGVILYNDGVGITLLFNSNSEFTIGCDIYRKVLSNSRLTDFSWYLQNLLMTLEREGSTIVSVNCVEYY